MKNIIAILFISLLKITYCYGQTYVLISGSNIEKYNLMPNSIFDKIIRSFKTAHSFKPFEDYLSPKNYVINSYDSLDKKFNLLYRNNIATYTSIDINEEEKTTQKFIRATIIDIKGNNINYRVQLLIRFNGEVSKDWGIIPLIEKIEVLSASEMKTYDNFKIKLLIAETKKSFEDSPPPPPPIK